MIPVCRGKEYTDFITECSIVNQLLYHTPTTLDQRPDKMNRKATFKYLIIEVEELIKPALWHFKDSGSPNDAFGNIHRTDWKATS